MFHINGYANNASPKELEGKIISKPTPSLPPQKEKSPISGTVDIASNYMFRGITYTDNLPALQGGLTYTFFKSGIYFNAWGSNVKFLDARGHTTKVEVDTAAGIYNKLGNHFTYDFSLNRYIYPRAVGVDYNEFVANLTYFFLTGLLGYSNDVFHSGKSGTYYNLGIYYDIPPKYFFNLNDINITCGYGHYSLPRSEGLESYNDYNLQLSKTIGSYNLALQWTDTNDRSSDISSHKNSHIVGKITIYF